MENKLMEDKIVYAYEGAAARNARTIKHLIIILLIQTIIIFTCFLTITYIFTQWDYYSENITVDSADGGNANYIGRDGDINNGADNSETEIPH